MKNLKKLIDIAGPPLAEPNDIEYDGLRSMLLEKNGFVAFESALVVYCSSVSDRWSIESMNGNGFWSTLYGAEAPRGVAFAADAFGNQFFMSDGRVSLFDVETAESEVVASSLDAWSAAVLDDFEYLTGYPLAHEWQIQHGPIERGCRIVPQTPFFLGGEYKVGNLQQIEIHRSLKLRAGIYRKTRGMPDGTKIKLMVEK